MQAKRWDVFISYASEDRQRVAAPLAAHLQKAGLAVWLDRHELKLGDSLREKIDEGLAESRFGALIISPTFLQKHWPKRELNALMSLEEGGQKVILPVWHEISKSELMSQSPLLADFLAADTSTGIHNVAKQIVDVVLDPSSGSPSADRPTVKRRFLNLIELPADASAIKDFVSYHPGSFADSRDLSKPLFGDYSVPIVVSYQGNIGPYLKFTDFGPVSAPLRKVDGKLAEDIEGAFSRLVSAFVWLVSHPHHELDPIAFGPGGTQFSIRLITRRRHELDTLDKELLARVLEEGRSVHTVRGAMPYRRILQTYDALLEEMDSRSTAVGQL